MIEFGLIGESADYDHAETAEIHLFEVIILDNERAEIMPGDSEQQLI